MRKAPNAIDRRAFVAAHWSNSKKMGSPRHGDIASILVQARPEHLADAEAAILAVDGCEIHGRDPRGKLVVVIDAADSDDVGRILGTIAVMQHVLSAALVFHATDVG